MGSYGKLDLYYRIPNWWGIDEQNLHCIGFHRYAFIEYNCDSTETKNSPHFFKLILLIIFKLYPKGLDTVASISLNDKLLSDGVINNMFVRYTIPLDQDVLLASPDAKNKLSISFESPVTFSKSEYEKYIDENGYNVKPDCQITQTECHVNHIRKMQSSFGYVSRNGNRSFKSLIQSKRLYFWRLSFIHFLCFRWDWGPAFPSMGIWKPLYLIGGDAPFTLEEALWDSRLEGEEWTVEVTLIFGSLEGGYIDSMTGTINITVEGIGTYIQCKCWIPKY